MSRLTDQARTHTSFLEPPSGNDAAVSGQAIDVRAAEPPHPHTFARSLERHHNRVVTPCRPTFGALLLSAAPQTNDARITGSPTSLIADTLILILALLTPRARRNALRKKNPRPVREGPVLQNPGLIATGPATPVYDAATQRTTPPPNRNA
ncbi:hypothetical protein ABZV29_34850 [Streptomyces sp. NPDC005236]|uniref:hypothetical protein n=1 Tax=Streptomyces sp. NPDC005236 TaxID=3157028 RepID=UPI0033B9BDBC